MLLEHKTAVIYGAGGAIGSAVAREIAKMGGVAQAAPVDARVGRAVAEALLRLGTVRVFEPLLGWIRTHKHEQGCYVVERALTYTGDRRDRRVVNRLIARVQEREPGLVREATIQALLWEGDVTAAAPPRWRTQSPPPAA